MLSPIFDKFLCQVLPDAEEIVSFKPEVGRSKIFWVCFKTRYGKVSRFLKKKISDWVQKVFEEFNQYNWIRFDTVESPSGESYMTTQTWCTCPDFNYSVNKGKSWRSFCKHQLMQLINKSLAEQIKSTETDDSAIRLRQFRKQVKQLTNKLEDLKRQTFFYENNQHFGCYYRLDSIGRGNAQFSITVNRDRLGRILIDSYTSEVKLYLKKSPNPLEFGDSLHAIEFLLKDVALFSVTEQQALNSLF